MKPPRITSQFWNDHAKKDRPSFVELLGRRHGLTRNGNPKAKDAAKKYGVSESTVYSWIRAGSPAGSKQGKAAASSLRRWSSSKPGRRSSVAAHRASLGHARLTITADIEVSGKKDIARTTTLNPGDLQEGSHLDRFLDASVNGDDEGARNALNGWASEDFGFGDTSNGDDHPVDLNNITMKFGEY